MAAEPKDILDDIAFKKILSDIVQNKITELTIWDKKIKNEQIQALAQALKKNTSVTGIIFGNTNLGPEGAKHIAEALKQNTSVKGIYLDNNNLGPEGAKYIAEVLKENTSVTEISLTNNNLGPEGAKHIAEALKLNTSVKEIYLYNNNLGPEGAKYIAEALKENTSVTSIYLTNNNLGPEGAKYIAEALKENTSITWIYLINNNLGPEGAKYIAEALKENTSITWISLFNNNLGPEEGKCLAEFGDIFKRNQAIQPIREAILAFSATTPLPSTNSASVEQKDEMEFNFNSRYQGILTQCDALRSQGCPDTILQSLRAEALLAYCSWDMGDTLTPEQQINGVLTTQQRIEQLQVLCQSFPENHPIKKKILLQLSDIALDKGIREVHAKRNIEAKAFFLLAYVSALGDRPHDTQAQAEALSLWMGKDTMSILAVLMQELQSNKVKLLEFQTAYQAQCKVLNLTPVDVLSQRVLPLPASSTASSAVSSAAKFTDVKDRKDSKDGKAAAAGVLSQFEQHKQKTSPTNGKGPSSSHASDASGVTVPNVNATSGPTGPNASAIQGLDEEDVSIVADASQETEGSAELQAAIALSLRLPSNQSNR